LRQALFPVIGIETVTNRSSCEFPVLGKPLTPEPYLGHINVVAAQGLPLGLHSLLKQAYGLTMPASIRQVLAQVLQGLCISHILGSKLSFCDVQTFTIVRLCLGKGWPPSSSVHFCQTVGNDRLMGVKLAKTCDSLFSGTCPPPFCIFIAFLEPQVETLAF
jgi:hypothetical protein